MSMMSTTGEGAVVEFILADLGTAEAPAWVTTDSVATGMAAMTGLSLNRGRSSVWR